MMTNYKIIDESLYQKCKRVLLNNIAYSLGARTEFELKQKRETIFL